MGAQSHGSRVDTLLTEWQPLAARCDALDHAMWERANALAHGLSHGRNVWSNAMIDYRAGRPWRDVDYSRLRHAIRIDEVQRSHIRRLRDRLWRALYARHFPEATVSA